MFKDLSSKYACKLNVVDCKNFNSHGMSLLIEVQGERMVQFLEDLKLSPGVRRVYATENHGDSAIAMVVLDAPVYCNVAQESGAFCTSCPFKTFEGDEANWRLIVKDARALSNTIDMLEKTGVHATLKDVSTASHNDTLTPRQRQVMLTAMRLGYFDFPRKKDLTHLAEEMNIRPSTLSEIMRRAESKITKYYIESMSSRNN